MGNIVIGIEGLVGSGKTSICRELKGIISNSIILHGGNIYRGIVYGFIKNGQKLDELRNKDIAELMKDLKVEIGIENNETIILMNGIKIDDEELQNKQTSMAVSQAAKIADNKQLFIYLRNIIDGFKEKYNVILSGRAIMQIYPDVDYHFFITADIDERVKRKAMQYNNNIDLRELKEHIEKRDKLQEETGFYKIYPNTIKVDVTECKTAKESTNKVLKYIEKV